MNDAIDRLIVERGAMDQGLHGALALSVLGHLALVASGLLAPLLMPREPPLKVVDGFAVALPPGGGGSPAAEAPAPAPAPPAPETASPPKPEPPPKVLKPPREAPKKGLPAPDAPKAKTKPEKSPPPPAAGGRGSAAAGQYPGLEFGPPAPGVPGGTDPLGDWYLAGVQRKIWLVWTQQIKTGFTRPIGVRFTILADGSLEDVRIIETSEVPLLDLAAKRAIYSAAPFGPLPREYGTNRYTIQAIFKPAP